MRRAAEIAVYARVTAEHKLRIIRALKANDAVVAMTGDGVNDAPAIKGADIGIAMGKSGTEVTKQAADMIITDDNFATIVAAVEEGRGIYDNIRKTLQYLLAGNTGELLLMTVCVVVGLPAPLLPIHLLWINLVTDGLPALCLATDPIDPDVMKRRPRPVGAHHGPPLPRHDVAHWLPHGGRRVRGLLLCASGREPRKRPALTPSRSWSLPNSCGPSVPAVRPGRSGAFPCSQTQPGHRGGRVFRYPDVEPTQRDVRPLSEDIIHAVCGLLPAARLGRHSARSFWR